LIRRAFPAFFVDPSGISRAMSQQNSTILIMGAGSIGSVVGGFLARAGHDVTLVGRQPHMEAIQSGGLHIDGIWGEHHVTGLRTATTCEHLHGQPFDLIILSVKSYDTEQAIGEAAPLLATDGLVISFQNGLGNVETIAARVGPERTLGGMVIFGARIDKPGHVTVTVYANEVHIGSPTGVIDRDRVEEVAALINASGVPTLATDEIEKHIWGKMLYNCALNPLSAILNVSYGELAAAADTRDIMNNVVGEIFAVAKARGTNLFWNQPEEFLKVFYDVLIPPTSAHYASMLEDLKRGGKTEIEALNGAIVSYGSEANVECPVNEALSNLIRVMERAYGTEPTGT
jgi:2-dehydropantoate 2-reductase